MMDTLQYAFSDQYLSNLKNEIEAGVGLDRYYNDEFVFDRTNQNIVQIANYYQPSGLLPLMMDSSSDLEAAIHLYEACEGITPLIASSENYWSYLCHVDLFQYVQKRWGTQNVPKDKLKGHIQTYYFYGKGDKSENYYRNALASLWWSVRCSIDEELDDKYELTRLFFKNQTFRTRVFNIMLRIRQGMLGILDFLKENPEVFAEKVERRGRFIASHFNQLGGSVLLSAMPREFFTEELVRIKEEILNCNQE